MRRHREIDIGTSPHEFNVIIRQKVRNLVLLVEGCEITCLVFDDKWSSIKSDESVTFVQSLATVCHCL